jgi:hypothetical protein
MKYTMTLLAALAIGGLGGCATTEPANPNLPTQQSLKMAHEQQVRQHFAQTMREQQIDRQIAQLEWQQSMMRQQMPSPITIPQFQPVPAFRPPDMPLSLGYSPIRGF